MIVGVTLNYQQKACCYHLYPEEFIYSADKLQISNFPWHINDKIHYFKCFDEYTIDAKKVRDILGYGQSQQKDQKLNNLFLKDEFHLGEEDQDVVIIAIYLENYRFKHINHNHKNNKSIVLRAMYDDINNFYYAGDTLKNDKRSMLEILRFYPDALEYLNETLQTDKEVIDIIIRTKVEALNNARYFQSDKEIVLFAIAAANDCWILQYVSKELKNDEDVVLAAVIEDSDAFQFASNQLKSNKEFIKKIGFSVQICEFIKYTDDTIKADKEIMLISVAQDGLVLYHASIELKNDLEVATTAMIQDRCALDDPIYNKEITDSDVLALYREHYE